MLLVSGEQGCSKEIATIVAMLQVIIDYFLYILVLYYEGTADAFKRGVYCARFITV